MDKRTQKIKLRRLAEERLASRTATASALSQVEANHLVHELRVHQIELEMQNEELKQSHAQVEITLQRYSDLYDFAPVGYLLLDHLGLILQANLTGANMLEVNRASLVGRRLAIFVTQDDRAALNAFIARAFANDAKQVCEVSLDQSVEQTESNCLFVRMEGGVTANRQECRVTMMDITDRKQAEEALRASEEKYRTVADFTYDWEAWRGVDGAYKYVSPSCERISGYTVAEFMADPNLVLRITHPDDQAGLSEHYRATLHEARHQPLEFDFRILTAGGETRWVSHSCMPVYAADGQWLGRRESNHEITERKHMEKRLHTLFHKAPDPMALFDAAQVFRDVNHAYETLTGYTLAELIGHTPLELGLVEEQENESVAIVRDLLRRGEVVPPYELLLRSKSGERIELEANLHSEIIAGENMTLVAMRDISSRKQAAAQLLKSNRRLEELNELKSGIVSMASHEFRTPLATIMFTADVLCAQRNKMDDAKIGVWLQRIVSESLHMQKMIDEVLQLSRRQAPGYTLNPALIDLDAECSEIVEQFQSNPTLAHTLVYTSNAQPLYALVDTKLMKEVITNLISNALKYSSTGTTVGIDLTMSETHVVLRVSDQGIGIPAEDLPMLFQPFHRAGNVGQVEGTGLGLSITKNAVELHGGVMTVESEVGKGTTFTITLPHSVA